MIVKIFSIWLGTLFLLTELFATDLLKEVLQIRPDSRYITRTDGFALNAVDQLQHMENVLKDTFHKNKMSLVNRELVTYLANAIGELITTGYFSLKDSRVEYGFRTTGPTEQELLLLTRSANNFTCLGSVKTFTTKVNLGNDQFVQTIRSINGERDLDLEIGLRCGIVDWKNTSPKGGKWRAGRDRTVGDDYRQEIMRQTERAWSEGFVTEQGEIYLPESKIVPSCLVGLRNTHQFDASVSITRVTDSGDTLDRKISEYFPIGISKKSWGDPKGRVTQYFVIQNDAVAAANLLRDRVIYGNHDTHPIAILNCAAARHIGGGARRGASAQEESLCLRSLLLRYLEEHALQHQAYESPKGAPKWGLDTADNYVDREKSGKKRETDCDSGILSPSVLFFRMPSNLQGTQYAFAEPLKYAVITSAAVDLRLRGNEKKLDAVHYEKMMKDKMRFQLRSALRHNIRSLVLAAFGCGVFEGKPEIVSRFYDEIFNEEEFSNQFEYIAFAIMAPDGHPNLECFKERFRCTVD